MNGCEQTHIERTHAHQTQLRNCRSTKRKSAHDGINPSIFTIYHLQQHRVFPWVEHCARRTEVISPLMRHCLFSAVALHLTPACEIESISSIEWNVYAAVTSYRSQCIFPLKKGVFIK